LEGSLSQGNLLRVTKRISRKLRWAARVTRALTMDETDEKLPQDLPIRCFHFELKLLEPL
jgi:hypothetical protein